MAKPRGNKENLIDISTRSAEERSAMIKKSAETRVANNKKRKQMKEELQLILQCQSRDRSVNHEFRRKGLQPPSMQTLMLTNLVNIACSPSKNAVAAATFIRDTLGEKPVDKQVTLQTDLEKFVAKLESDKEF